MFILGNDPKETQGGKSHPKREAGTNHCIGQLRLHPYEELWKINFRTVYPGALSPWFSTTVGQELLLPGVN